MIHLTVATFSELLSNHLKIVFKLNEDIVQVAPLASQDKNVPSNKIHVFLTNIERETGGGIQFGQQTSGKLVRSGGISWQLNLYLMIAAVFNEKQYGESLSLMSGVALFLQSHNVFSVKNTSQNVCVEPVNLSFSELSNLWSIFGSMYYPSILCKIRVLDIDSREIKHFAQTIRQKDVDASEKDTNKMEPKLRKI
ncbi:MAG: DUF4255 domain-containing protein [Bacteroidales bacterium]|jgi:hypothetical protein|nr:DUF4255 domain-containing protein [Bacteroidales bacterium]